VKYHLFSSASLYDFSWWYNVYSLEYTRSYLFSWTRYGTQRNDHSSWNLFNLTAVIESTLVLEYTRLARRLIGFIVEIHREAGLARATHCARALLPQKNQRPVIGTSNLAAPFRFRSQWLIAGRGRASPVAGPATFEEQTPLGFLHLAKRFDG